MGTKFTTLDIDKKFNYSPGLLITDWVSNVKINCLCKRSGSLPGGIENSVQSSWQCWFDSNHKQPNLLSFSVGSNTLAQRLARPLKRESTGAIPSMTAKFIVYFSERLVYNISNATKIGNDGRRPERLEQ